MSAANVPRCRESSLHEVPTDPLATPKRVDRGTAQEGGAIPKFQSNCTHGTAVEVFNQPIPCTGFHDAVDGEADFDENMFYARAVSLHGFARWMQTIFQRFISPSASWHRIAGLLALQHTSRGCLWAAPRERVRVACWSQLSVRPLRGGSEQGGNLRFPPAPLPSGCIYIPSGTIRGIQHGLNMPTLPVI